MSDPLIPTARSAELIDAELQKPPKADKLILLSIYGVLAIGTYQPGFHVAWAPLLKVPESVKSRLREGTTACVHKTS